MSGSVLGNKFTWRTPVIAIDFDGCLCRDEYPEIGQPNKEVIAEAKLLQKHGACLVLWTCRAGEKLTAAVEACQSWGLEFDYINENPKHLIDLYGNDTRKISADEYWDDRSVWVGGREARFRNINGCNCEIRSEKKIREFINEAITPTIQMFEEHTEKGCIVSSNQAYAMAAMLKEAKEQMELLLAHIQEPDSIYIWYKHGYKDATENAASWVADMFKEGGGSE